MADHNDDDEVGVKSEPTGWHDNADVYLGHAVDEPEPDVTDCYDASDNSNVRQGCQMVFLKLFSKRNNFLVFYKISLKLSFLQSI